MIIDNSPPPSYKRLPPIGSETSDKYRWPVIQTRQPYIPMKGKISVDGPLQSPPPKPRLRYHRQSTYTDVYIGQKPFSTQMPPVESSWMDPVGKYGDFDGVSTYEKDFEWPNRSSELHKLPLVSTIGMGILPLLGTSGDGGDVKDTGIARYKRTDEEDTILKYEVGDKRKKRQARNKLSIETFEPLQDIWTGETTHRSDFLIPPKGWKTELNKPPNPELKFSGVMQTSTTAMRDFQDPKHVKYEEDFLPTIHPKKIDSQSRYPFFLF